MCLRVRSRVVLVRLKILREQRHASRVLSSARRSMLGTRKTGRRVNHSTRIASAAFATVFVMSACSAPLLGGVKAASIEHLPVPGIAKLDPTHSYVQHGFGNGYAAFAAFVVPGVSDPSPIIHWYERELPAGKPWPGGWQACPNVDLSKAPIPPDFERVWWRVNGRLSISVGWRQLRYMIFASKFTGNVPMTEATDCVA
jgi:hypothetical protein